MCFANDYGKKRTIDICIWNVVGDQQYADFGYHFEHDKAKETHKP